MTTTAATRAPGSRRSASADASDSADAKLRADILAWRIPPSCYDPDGTVYSKRVAILARIVAALEARGGYYFFEEEPGIGWNSHVPSRLRDSVHVFLHRDRDGTVVFVPEVWPDRTKLNVFCYVDPAALRLYKEGLKAR